jgi:Zn-dependent protease with chaperone function
MGVRWVLRLAVGVAILGTGGCAAPRGDAIRLDLAADPVPAVERLDVAARRVAPEGRLDVALSPRSDAGAWSWPDGRIRVSRPLVAALDDDELAAVIAHELGHLALGASGPVHSVAGTDRHLAAEVAADRAGCALLAARGVRPAAMVRMLERLALVASLDLEARILAAAEACERF